MTQQTTAEAFGELRQACRDLFDALGILILLRRVVSWLSGFIGRPA